MEGGTGIILRRGDATAGAILVVALERGIATAVLERSLGADGYAVRPTGPADPADGAALDAYLDRRRRSDPDLWIVELEGDGGLGERIAREVLGG